MSRWRSASAKGPAASRISCVSASLSAKWIAIGRPSAVHGLEERIAHGVGRVRRDAEADEVGHERVERGELLA